MFKIIGIAFIGVLCFSLIRSAKPEIAPLLLLATGAAILILLSDTIGNVIQTFSSLTEKSGLSNTVLSAVLKVIGIGYLTEYATNVCDDCGCSSIGKKIELSGKITIFVMALPVINGIVDIIGNLI